ncbi:hypothetical protein B296_00023382 [Ensete ventricosum]|uniref:Retrotransposon gag domain-containing protein n=1 Tax=Ensete ventricosum TaxID=4639 RepID=A0A427A235_ENSVE|nr:hypothetical protein B296_00023382 [Ensete ventricosum]
MPSGSEGSSPFSLMEMGTPRLRPCVATRGYSMILDSRLPDQALDIPSSPPRHSSVQREFVKLKEELGESISVGSPFAQEIQDKQFLLNFRLLTLEAYDDSSDLAEHVIAFRAQMTLYDTFDALMCRAFPTTLRGLARI